MDKTKAMLEEIYKKASNFPNSYELIMSLMNEASSKLRILNGENFFMSFGVTGNPEDCGQL